MGYPLAAHSKVTSDPFRAFVFLGVVKNNGAEATFNIPEKIELLITQGFIRVSNVEPGFQSRIGNEIQIFEHRISQNGVPKGHKF